MRAVLLKNYGRNTAGTQVEFSDEEFERLSDEQICISVDEWECSKEPYLVECILTESWNGLKAGTKIEVNEGLCQTLIDLNKAMPIYECIDTENEMKEIREENNKLREEIEVLKKCKDLRTKPKNKMIKNDQVTKKDI